MPKGLVTGVKTWAVGLFTGVNIVLKKSSNCSWRLRN